MCLEVSFRHPIRHHYSFENAVWEMQHSLSYGYATDKKTTSFDCSL